MTSAGRRLATGAVAAGNRRRYLGYLIEHTVGTWRMFQTPHWSVRLPIFLRIEPE